MSAARSGSTSRRSADAGAGCRGRKPLPSPKSHPHRGAPRSVVVIDDNEANLDLLRRVLALRPGIRVVFGRDGAEGLALVAAEVPDLVLLDMHLPAHRRRRGAAPDQGGSGDRAGFGRGPVGRRRRRDHPPDPRRGRRRLPHQAVRRARTARADRPPAGAAVTGSTDYALPAFRSRHRPMQTPTRFSVERAAAPRRAKQVEAMNREAAVAQAAPWRLLPAAAVGHLAHDLRGCHPRDPWARRVAASREPRRAGARERVVHRRRELACSADCAKTSSMFFACRIASLPLNRVRAADTTSSPTTECRTSMSHPSRVERCQSSHVLERVACMLDARPPT